MSAQHVREINVAKSEVHASKLELNQAMDHLEELVGSKAAQVGHAIESVKKPVRSVQNLGNRARDLGVQAWDRTSPVILNRWFQSGLVGMIVGIFAGFYYQRRQSLKLVQDEAREELEIKLAG